ncbi:MAG: hypothetical protein WCJ92_02245 [Alphaproteobacteria bacterium]
MALFKKIFFLLKPMMRVALLIITNSCNASYTPQDVRYYDSSQTASRLPLYQRSSPQVVLPASLSSTNACLLVDVRQTFSSQTHSITTHEFLLSIHNIHDQLNKIRFKEMSFAGKGDLLARYNQLIDVIEFTDLNYWSQNEITQLRCYHLSLLLGAANLCGALRNNKQQFERALKAYKFLETLSCDINNAYLDGRTLSLAPTTCATVKILCRAAIFSADIDRKIFLNNLIADNNVLSASEKLYFGDCLVNDFVPR